MKKCVIITTINDYINTSIPQLITHLKDYDIIIVGDNKTPHHSYNKTHIIYLYNTNILSNLPKNHYCQKNIGYIYAIQNDYDEILETDDDNYLYPEWEKYKNNKVSKINSPKLPNILSFFDNPNIWLRGYPLQYVKKEQKLEIENIHLNDNVAIIQSLIDNDPDVDAICRMTNHSYNTDIVFSKENTIIYEKNVYGQGNTQGTLWLNKKIFYLLYLPSTVSFRFCDILKMYIAQKCIWYHNLNFAVISPIFYQKRNEHNYMNDFISEYEMYKNILLIIDNIFEEIKLNGNIYDLITIL